MRNPARTKLGDRLDLAVAVVLSVPTLDEAAKLLGVSRRTLEREYNRPDFQAALRARTVRVADDVVAETVEKIKQLGPIAADAARDIITDETYDPSARASLIRFALEKSASLEERKHWQGILAQLDELASKAGA